MNVPTILRWCAIKALAVTCFCALFFAQRALSDEVKAEASATTTTAAVYSQEGNATQSLAPTPSNKVVFTDTKTFIQGWVEYNIYTCALVDSGITKALSSPRYGKISYGTQNFTLSSSAGNCAGTVLPFSVTYYTWTDTQTTAKEDAFTLEWYTSDGYYTEDTSWTITLGPRIYFNGKDVTNTTQTVALGQKIVLTTEPTETGQTQHWDGDLSNTVGGYVTGPTGKVTATDFAKSSTTFFWTGLGAKAVNYNVSTSQGHGTAQAKFTVQGPTSVSVTTSLGDVQIIDNNYLSFGNVNATPGITFTERGGTTTQSGQYLWAQLINYDISFVYVIGGKMLTCTVGTGLDNTFPYNDVAGVLSTDDSPAGVLQSIWSKRTKQMRFRMFLMWQSSTAGSIPVSLGSVYWSWSGAAVQAVKSGTWTLQAGSTKWASAFGAGNDFPLWTNVVINAPPKCH